MLIPEMGGTQIGPWLSKYVKGVKPGHSVVEVGAWLGAGTQFLAAHCPLYVYDRFQANASEVKKAETFGVQLREGEDTLPWVKARLPLGITYIKGDIREATYSGPLIGMYVDDASKRAPLWDHVMSVFEPHFVPCETIIVLMDYHYPVCAVQREYAKKWTLLEERVAGTSCAIFRC